MKAHYHYENEQFISESEREIVEDLVRIMSWLHTKIPFFSRLLFLFYIAQKHQDEFDRLRLELGRLKSKKLIEKASQWNPSDFGRFLKWSYFLGAHEDKPISKEILLKCKFIQTEENFEESKFGEGKKMLVSKGTQSTDTVSSKFKNVVDKISHLKPPDESSQGISQRSSQRSDNAGPKVRRKITKFGTINPEDDGGLTRKITILPKREHRKTIVGHL